jgi:hypothetical protein
VRKLQDADRWVQVNCEGVHVANAHSLLEPSSGLDAAMKFAESIMDRLNNRVKRDG